jgi:hypothetical protein
MAEYQKHDLLGPEIVLISTHDLSKSLVHADRLIARIPPVGITKCIFPLRIRSIGQAALRLTPSSSKHKAIISIIGNFTT